MYGPMGRIRHFLFAAAFSATLFLQTAANGGTPAIYVFGDSSVDVGNNNYLPGNLGKVNFPPYGVDYPGGKPTGRFSNGYNVADFLGRASRIITILSSLLKNLLEERIFVRKTPPLHMNYTNPTPFSL